MTAQREPSLPPPVILPMADCVLLGTIRGLAWVKHRSAEYALERHAIRDDSTERLSDGRTYISDSADDGSLIFWPARQFPAGTFARGGRLPAPPKVQRKAGPAKRVDLLAQFPLFQERRSQPIVIMRPENPTVGMPLQAPVAFAGTGRAAARGAAALEDRLASAGAVCELSPSGRLVPVSKRGGMRPELRDAWDAAAPLIEASKRGAPLVCDWCDAAAVTLLVGNVPICEQHLDEEIAPPEPPTLRERARRALRR